MIPFLSPFFLRLIGGKAKWLADLLAVLAVVALLFGGWNLWLHFHDKNVVKQHEAGVTNQVHTSTTKARDTADTKENDRAADFEQRQTQDRKDIENAKAGNSSPLDAVFD